MNEERAKEIKIVLIRHGWNQGDLASKIGVSPVCRSFALKGPEVLDYRNGSRITWNFFDCETMNPMEVSKF